MINTCQGYNHDTRSSGAIFRQYIDTRGISDYNPK